jgi:transcriptional regulator with XRE-family HTH domain
VKILRTLTDQTVLEELGRRLAAFRLEKNMTQIQLAEEAGVSKSTLQRLESGEVATQLSGLLRVCRALELLDRFDALLPEAVPSPMAQLKQKGRKRQRAKRKKVAAAPKKWTWAEQP